MTAFALRLERLSKTYSGVQALQEVTVSVGRRRLHALLGGNGSGKSTLIKCVAGVVRADHGGRVTVGEHVVRADKVTPATAKSMGLRFVHQDLGLFPSLTVADNLAIGSSFPTRGRAMVDERSLRAHARVVLDRYGIDAEPGTTVERLRPADRTLLAIARALKDSPKVLLLDEPTVALPRAEVDRLLRSLRSYVNLGHSIVFVTHRLDEALSIADDASVLRDGRVAGEVARADFTKAGLARLIAGRRVSSAHRGVKRAHSQRPALSVRGLVGGPVGPVSVDVYEGEIVGIAGLLGSGRSRFLRMLAGDLPVTDGTVEVAGRPHRLGSVQRSMAAGIAMVPEDRLKASAFLSMSAGENLSAAVIREYWKRAHLHRRAMRRDENAAIKRFRIRASSVDQRFSTLSGGNQQKTVLARWLRRRPQVLLLDEPTQGVDIGARQEIYALVREATVADCAALVASNDFNDLVELSDRVLVLRDGEIVEEWDAPGLSPEFLTERVLTGTGA